MYVRIYISNIQSVTVTIDSQKTLLEQMKVSRILYMSGSVCTYIHFQHTDRDEPILLAKFLEK